MTGVQKIVVSADENGMRVDRFLEARFPALAFSHIQRIIRKGELRVNGKRAQPSQRLESGQAVRVPPLQIAPDKPKAKAGDAGDKTRDFLGTPAGRPLTLICTARPERCTLQRAGVGRLEIRERHP